MPALDDQWIANFLKIFAITMAVGIMSTAITHYIAPPSLDERAKETADEITRSPYKAVNPYMIIEKASYDGREFTYVYKITLYTADRVNSAYIKYLGNHSSHTAIVCDSELPKELLQQGKKVTLIYKSRDDVTLTSLSYTRENCPKRGDAVTSSNP